MTNFAVPLMLVLLTGSGEATPTATSSSPARGVDTTFAVREGTRLEVENFAGEIDVRTWGREAIRVEASHSRRTRVDFERTSSVLRIRARGRMVPASVRYKLTVPHWMPLELNGMSTNIAVMGARAPVKAKTINGDIRIEGASDLVSVSSVQGSVRVIKVNGRVDASSMNQGVRISDVVGDVVAESMNGNVIVDQVEGRSIEASSVNGNIVFAGNIKSGGVYTLSTHNGSVIVGLPESPDVEVSVATFSGGFSSNIPIRVAQGRRGKRFSFTLGSGNAKLELESFQGSIQLANFQKVLERLGRLELQLSGEHDHDDEMDHEDDHDHDDDEEK
jgi:hypothetical protein